MTEAADVGGRRAYHHGDLERALVAAGLAAARSGGVDAIVLREATRAAGVSPRAAYRHFAGREALVAAVASAAQGRLADVITARIDQISARRPAERALGLLRSVGEGYVEFALAEPGWFEVAFFGVGDMATAEAITSAGADGRSPFQLLVAALDALLDAGILPADRRPGAEVFCWSAVHGYAVLATRGPLRQLPREEAARLGGVVVLRAVEGAIGGTVADAVGQADRAD